MVQFAKFTTEERDVVAKIADRFRAMLPPSERRYTTPLDVQMDLAAVSYHMPLRLAELLAADDFNFSHDMGGIRRHLNRETGELEDCFVPRFARRVAVEAL